MKNIFLMLFMTVIIMSGCSNPSESENEAPADHTVNQDGVRHKSGLNDPEVNCVACHGADLRGGQVGVSCYQCHGKKW